MLVTDLADSPIVSSTVRNRHTYTGRLLETDTGLIQFRNRYMSPTLGRFVHRDPLGYIDGMSQTVYASTNPMSLVDPMGTCSQSPRMRFVATLDPDCEDCFKDAGKSIRDCYSCCINKSPSNNRYNSSWCQGKCDETPRSPGKPIAPAAVTVETCLS